jgi:hypothetical protein
MHVCYSCVSMSTISVSTLPSSSPRPPLTDPPPLSPLAGDRPYEVLEFNITSDPVRQTRSFCADGNLSCENLPRLTSVLQPLAQQWSRDTSMWGLIMGRR